MLPVPGRGSGIAKLSKPVVNLLASGPAAPAEESLSLTDDEADFSDLSLESALPLELEMELGEFAGEQVERDEREDGNGQSAHGGD